MFLIKFFKFLSWLISLEKTYKRNWRKRRKNGSKACSLLYNFTIVDFELTRERHLYRVKVDTFPHPEMPILKSSNEIRGNKLDLKSKTKQE